MYSQSFQNLLLQAHNEELNRQAANRHLIAAERRRAIRHAHSARLSAYLKRAVERCDDRAAGISSH
jgi:hypothetical protein